MRPPCVLLLLAFAARPVGVAAHAELSDNAATDGRHEVQEHLRIRAHDADDDERTGPQVGEISSPNVLNDVASLLKILIAGTNRNDALNNEILNLETPDLSAKVLGKRKPSAEQKSKYRKKVVTEAIQAYEEMKQGKNPKISTDTLAAFNTKTDRAYLYRVANQILLDSGYTPKEAFETYFLQSAGDELFRPNLLFFWANFLDAYNKANKTNISMLTILEKYYSFRHLVVAARKYYRTTISMKVLSDLAKATLDQNIPPYVVYEWLRFGEGKKNWDLKEPFYRYYYKSYYKKFPEKTEGLWKETEISIKDMETDDDVGTSIPDEEKVPMFESMLKILADADLDTPK